MPSDSSLSRCECRAKPTRRRPPRSWTRWSARAWRHGSEQGGHGMPCGLSPLARRSPLFCHVVSRMFEGGDSLTRAGRHRGATLPSRREQPTPAVLPAPGRERTASHSPPPASAPSACSAAASTPRYSAFARASRVRASKLPSNLACARCNSTTACLVCEVCTPPCRAESLLVEPLQLTPIPIRHSIQRRSHESATSLPTLTHHDRNTPVPLRHSQSCLD